MSLIFKRHLKPVTAFTAPGAPKAKAHATRSSVDLLAQDTAGPCHPHRPCWTMLCPVLWTPAIQELRVAWLGDRLQGEDSEGHGSYRSCRGGAPGTTVSVASSGGNVVKAMHVTP